MYHNLFNVLMYHVDQFENKPISMKCPKIFKKIITIFNYHFNICFNLIVRWFKQYLNSLWPIMHCHINLLIQIHDSMSRLLGCTPSSLICECTHLVWVLFICGLQIKIIQFVLDPYAIEKYCTSYMTKINKSITS